MSRDVRLDVADILESTASILSDSQFRPERSVDEADHLRSLEVLPCGTERPVSATGHGCSRGRVPDRAFKPAAMRYRADGASCLPDQDLSTWDEPDRKPPGQAHW